MFILILRASTANGERRNRRQLRGGELSGERRHGHRNFDTIDTTTMNLSGPEYVAEANPATYTISVDNAPQTDMTVDVTLAISASTNDVVTNTTQVVLEASQTSAQFAVDAVDDMIHEGIETFNVSISNPQGGSFENLVLENANVATNIADSDAPPFSISAT